MYKEFKNSLTAGLQGTSQEFINEQMTKNDPRMEVDEPDHVLVARKMASEILKQPLPFQIEMLYVIKEMIEQGAIRNKEMLQKEIEIVTDCLTKL